MCYCRLVVAQDACCGRVIVCVRLQVVSLMHSVATTICGSQDDNAHSVGRIVQSFAAARCVAQRLPRCLHVLVQSFAAARCVAKRLPRCLRVLVGMGDL